MKLAPLLFLALVIPSQAAFVWDDPSPANTDWQFPASIQVTEGSNPISLSLNPDGFCPIFFTLEIAEGFQISRMSLTDFSTGSQNVASLLAMQPGPTLGNSPAEIFSLGIPINNMLLAESLEDQSDILPLLFQQDPADGPTPLSTGRYAFWANETSRFSGSEFTLDFIVEPVPEPSSLAFLVMVSFPFLRRKRLSVGWIT